MPSDHRPAAAGAAAPVDLASALAGVDEPWSPRTVATLNDYDVRVVKVAGEFTWHSHPDTDELFHVLAGEMDIELEDGPAPRTVRLGPGQVFVVPRGVRHRPVSSGGAEVLLVEPGETVNTGDNPGRLTAERRVV